MGGANSKYSKKKKEILKKRTLYEGIKAVEQVFDRSMGNELSSGGVAGMAGALPLQCQGAEHLWSLELNRGKGGEGEGVCVFSRTFGNGAQDDLCRAGLEVSGVIWKKEISKTRTPY